MIDKKINKNTDSRWDKFKNFTPLRSHIHKIIRSCGDSKTAQLTTPAGCELSRINEKEMISVDSFF